MIRVWPDLIAWIILGIGGLYALSFMYLVVMFSEVAEKVFFFLFYAVPIAAVIWALTVVL